MIDAVGEEQRTQLLQSALAEIQGLAACQAVVVLSVVVEEDRAVGREAIVAHDDHRAQPQHQDDTHAAAALQRVLAIVPYGLHTSIR